MTAPLVIFTKKKLISRLLEIREMGWIKSRRHGNVGSVGNTLEDLLGIKENNLPIPNAAEWELKCQRLKTASLTTLFHIEPSPTALKFVPSILLPRYGWSHKEAGKKYSLAEMSFRQTISTQCRSDRGFNVIVDKKNEKILISFDAKAVSPKHDAWLNSVNKRVGLSELSPQPYWGFNDLCHKAGTKLLNCFFVGADTKRIRGKEYFQYQTILMLKTFSKTKFLRAIEKGDILVDFDARTGHNHGTKFRYKNSKLPELYDDVTEIA